jgi:hypothetical protein
MRWGTATAGLGITPTPTMIDATEIISDGRQPVGTIAQDPATGMWQARHLYAGVLAPLIESDCGRHETKAAAVEAVLSVSGVHSVWDM